MIRSTRLCLLGKSYLNISSFPKRTVALPLCKHPFLQYSVVADEREKLENNTQKPEAKTGLEVKFNPQAESELSEELKEELKASFLRDIVSGGSAEDDLFRNSRLTSYLSKVTDFKPHEIIQAFKIMIETNRRPVSLIQTLCKLLTNYEKSFSVQECSNLLYCLCRLSYRDDETIAFIVRQLKNVTEFENPKIAAGLLHSLSDLKHRDSILLNLLYKYVGRQGTLSTKGKVRCLRAASILNYTTSEVEELIQFLSYLKKIDFVQTVDYIDFVWSTLLLNKESLISTEHIEAVLSENYVTRLICSGVQPSVKWKLLNINGVARQMPSYNGPILNNQSFYKMMTLTIPSQKSMLLSSVLDALGQVLPEKAVIRPLVNTGSGFYIDVEFEMSGPEPTSKDAVNPKGGVVLLNFKDICSDGVISGMANFKVKLMKGMGYKTFLIPYLKYNFSDTLENKIEYLRKIIKEEAPELLPESKDKGIKSSRAENKRNNKNEERK